MAMKRGLNCLIIVAFLIAVQIIFVSAAPTVSPTSLSGNINQNSTITITITNTALVQASGGINTNITKVTITLPAGLLFWAGTNTTTAPPNFTSTSSNLIWENYTVGGSQYLIGGGESKIFTFIANATSVGSVNMTITTTNFSGDGVTRLDSQIGFNLTIIDNPPTISFVSPTPQDGNVSKLDDIQANVSASDDVGIRNITIYLYNKTSSLVSSKSTTSSTFLLYDFVNLDDGIYYLNATVNDTFGNLVSTETRKITINATIISSCTENWNCTSYSVCSNGNQSRTCTDSNNCGTNSTKPSLIQACVSAPLCVPDWQCVGWLPLNCPQNGTQTRTCTDKSSCGDNTAKPSESKTCTPQSSGSSWIFVVIILVLLFSGGAVALIFYFKNKKQEEVYQPQVPSDSPQNGYVNPQGYSYKYT